MRWWVIRERDGPDIPDLLHFVKVPTVGEPGFYRSILSIEGFRNRECSRIYDCNQRRKKYGRWFHVARFDEYMMDKRSWRRTFDKHQIDRMPSPPCRKYHSIWDFYAAIGYDYKRKRFLPRSSQPSRLPRQAPSSNHSD